MPRFEVPTVREGGDLFGKGVPSWHDAILAVYHPSWSVYVKGYRIAADQLADLALTERTNRDFVIYPMLFLYRQFLELGLKEAIIYAVELRDEALSKQHDHHRLGKLWHQFEALMEKVSDGSLNEHVEVVKNAVQQFASLDPTSQLFRYPEERDRSPVRYPIERVSLPTLKAEMGNAGTALDMISGALSAKVDVRRDAENEMRP